MNTLADTGLTTVTLTRPIVQDGREIAEITLRRPKVGDLRRMDKVPGGDLTKTLWMIGALASLTPQEVDDLDAADLDAIARVIAGFTGKGQE